MSRGGPAATLVCELVAAGRGAAAQPAFEPGPRIPLAKGARGDAEVGDLVVVTMRGRAGRVAEVLGPSSSPRAALAGLLAAEGLARPFPRAALREADEADDSAVAADRGRRDLRDQRVITIDPEGAKDHDDAIAVAAEPDGAVRLWVHIADVSRFVPAGAALDREAARRGNSVYVPGAVVPMLPERLSSDLCSLRPGVDRAAVTAEMVIDADGAVEETRFSRSLIRSERRLTYPEVDGLLAGGGLGDPALEEDVRRASGLAAALRERRVRRGALEADSAEPVVRFEGDRVAGIRLEGQTPAHSLVEECMIAANEAVARYMIARSAPTVFRHHEEPAQSRIELLYAQLEELGVPTPPLPRGELGPAQCRRAAAAAAAEVARYVAARGVRRQGAVAPGAALAAPGALLAGRARALGAGEPGLPALHVADPPLPRPARPPGPPRRARHRGPGPRPGRARRGRRPLVGHRARGGLRRAPRRRHLRGLPAARPARRRRLGRPGHRHRDRAHRRRPVPGLRRGLHRLPALAAS